MMSLLTDEKYEYYHKYFLRYRREARFLYKKDGSLVVFVFV